MWYSVRRCLRKRNLCLLRVDNENNSCLVSRIKTFSENEKQSFIYAWLLKLKFCGSQEALLFAQCQLTDFGKEQKYVKKLEVCSSNNCILFYITLGFQFDWICYSSNVGENVIVQDFMALLAYDEPEKSPMFHLLSSEHRQYVAESLNRAILGTYFLIWHASGSVHYISLW